MSTRPIPGDIQVPWEDLLANRTLLHEHLKAFPGREDFVAKMVSSKVRDRRDVAALERFAEEVFNIYMDLGRELLVQMHPEGRAEIKALMTETVLTELRRVIGLSDDIFEVLDEIRQVRNSMQHGDSFVLGAAAWRGIVETERVIDKALTALQAGFDQRGYVLEMDFPDLERDA